MILEFVKVLQLKANKIIILTTRPFEHISQHMKENYAIFLHDYCITNAGAVIYGNKGHKLYAKYL